jgi:hypothetical protein
MQQDRASTSVRSTRDEVIAAVKELMGLGKDDPAAAAPLPEKDKDKNKKDDKKSEDEQ